MMNDNKQRAILWGIFFVCVLLLAGLTFCARTDPFEGLPQDPAVSGLRVAVDGAHPAPIALLTAEAQVYLAQKGITVSFGDKENPFDESGMQEIGLRLTAAAGATMVLTVHVECVEDTTPPTITGVEDRSALCGEALILREGVRAEDDCYGEVTLDVDASAVDAAREGAYPVTYTATDACGNRTVQAATVYIYEQAVTEQMLWARIDELISRLVMPGMTREQQCRRIYDCLQASLFYMPDSDKSDWVRNAYVSLFVRGGGDCFSYFASAKALLHRLGIPYMEIQRTAGLTEDTHYWLLVNIAEEGEADRWYYFDPTELREDEYRHSGCLLTLAQLEAYDAVRPYFYAHDVQSYPTTETKIITPTPELGLE
jgi:hypothetical protein